MAFDEKVAEIMSRPMQELVALLLDEAHQALGEPIERYKLTHDRNATDCLALMSRNDAGDWVPAQHHAACVIVLAEAVKLLRESTEGQRQEFLRKIDANVAIGEAVLLAKGIIRGPSREI